MPVYTALVYDKAEPSLAAQQPGTGPPAFSSRQRSAALVPSGIDRGRSSYRAFDRLLPTAACPETQSLRQNRLGCQPANVSYGSERR